MLHLLSIIIVLYIVSREDNFCKAHPLSGWTSETAEYEFSFLVSIGRKFDIDYPNIYGHVCGGALISGFHVLTSAHCFLKNKTVDDYFVYAGSIDLKNSEKYKIESWITYNKWLKLKKRQGVKHFSDNDIIIIRLVQGLNMRTRLPYISNRLPSTLIGLKAMTAGWGLQFNDTIPRYLLKADLRVISANDCTNSILIASNLVEFSLFEENIFCTQGDYLFTVLNNGDRGSPIFLRDDSGQYEIIGVNQKSVPVVHDITHLPDQRNRHISVYYYRTFMRSVTKYTRL